MIKRAKKIDGLSTNKDEMMYEMAEMLSLDNVHMAAKAKQIKKYQDLTQKQMIEIPELGLIIYASKDKDPNEVRNKYIEHAKAQHQRLNPVIEVKPEIKKKTSNAKARNDSESGE